MAGYPAFFSVLLLCNLAIAEPLSIPAFTAYLEAQGQGARVSSSRGVVDWTNRKIKVLWFGELRTAGLLEAKVMLRVPPGRPSHFRLTVDDHSREVEVKGAGDDVVTAAFGNFDVKKPGYYRFALEALNAAAPFGDVIALVIDGPATKDAHFNLKPRRNAASVHLRYPTPKGSNIAAFYCEVTGIEEPVTTYYMACGWHRGYFGMQVNSETERRIIFSVWDSGNEAIDRRKVTDENRVTLMGKGEGVYAGDFGNEGTGGHSHLKYMWKTGETQRFLVTAQPTNKTFTVYSGYWFHPEKRAWMLISSWRAPKDGSYMRGLYSFSENFGRSTGHLRRKALYGNQWVRTESGNWIELTAATFSHDSTGRADRLDRFMGIEDDKFFLSHGGFVPGCTQTGEKFSRLPTAKPPVVHLP